MRIKMTESVTGAELKSLLDEIKDNLNFQLVSDKEDEQDYTLIIKGKVLDDKLLIRIIHEYNNGNTWNTLLTIEKDDEDRLVVDASDEYSVYNSRYHEPFNTTDEVIEYMKRFEL